MSFLEYKDCPQAGDTVIVYLHFNLFYPLVLKEGETFQTKYGAMRHNDVIGRPYGSRIAVKNGFVHCLWPTPELWTLALPHRTQILYTRDITLTTFQLDLRPGSVVVESGTGSGSMTHSLARAVAPHGKVYTFDFHLVRSEMAQKEFSSHGLNDIVICAHRDVCTDGFGLTGVADAVFLDLPHPWLAVHHAIQALKDTGGRICSFSPCIEQVQKTCDRLRELRCVELTTMECLERPYEVKKVHFVKQNIGAERHRIGSEYFVTGASKKDEAIEEREEKVVVDEGDSPSSCEVSEKRADEKRDDPEDEDEASKAKIARSSIEGEVQRGQKKPLPPGESRLCAIPSIRIPGHTGYLTFATYLGGNAQ
ncbi:tRNA (adenine(58)-N(1))-methyltransferase catalytic subunit TRMT61A-like isoform X1 [Varroa destructor]|uniref:tRNA (adenine(58)-N(1))-methyltransferase catalytic subunit TRMT61A n=2 Tax=Varroa destructor TaxID=109461 RepID=A0A7M7KER2_VARDE|nr:tRNA (adenine(58)-N(1))-methyltransferase catalytic subunit TRMT61A-like isoform X1 [Varroa destructor]